MEFFNWSHPGYKPVEVNLLWNVKVPFLNTIGRNEERLLSPEELFSPQETPKSKWRLEMVDRYTEIGIYVTHYNSAGKPGFFVQPAIVKMSILERSGLKVFQQIASASLHSRVIPFIVSKESLMESKCLQLDGSLTFCCQILTSVELVPSSVYPSVLAIDFTNGLSTPFDDLFNSMPPRDVIFKVRGREFPAHKSILTAKSEVFAAMFHHPMEEQSTGVAKIEDIDPDVFQELLSFIYTGQVQLKKLETMAASLFIAADKYLLDELKLKCENYVTNHISPENCAVLLLNSDLIFPSEPLMNAAKFFRVFPHQVMSTNEWKKQQQENPAGLHDVFKFIHNQ